MEIFRNYFQNEPKKPLTMEDSWSKVCTRWANSLELTPVRELINLSDGKFFAAFMSKYLPWNSNSNSVSETFQQLEAGLRNEFPFGSVVRMNDARGGHEEELVKVMTLLMYLAAVKHLNPDLSATLQDSKLFSKEVQLRFKCILQALMEQHSVLTPALLGEIMMSKVSETTGQLTAPVIRARLADRPATRVGKPSPGSPVIFSSNGSGSPLKDFLDSPQTRQVATYQRMVEERNAQTRQLRTELENEKTEKQFLIEESTRMKEQTKKLEEMMAAVKQELRDKNTATEMADSSMNDGELSQKYHQLMKEQKDQGKYLERVEQQLVEVEEEKARLETRLTGVMEKLSSATDDKHRVEMSMEDMRVNLTETRSENNKLSENVDELQGQVEDLSQQLQLSFLSGGRKSLAPSMTSFHFNPCDMTNVSVDADDSVGGVGNSFGENMGDVMGQQFEEKIDNLQMEKGQLEGEIEMEREIRERTQVELQKEREVKEEFETKVETLEQELNEETNKMVMIEGELEKERVEKDYVVMEVNKLKNDCEKLEANHKETTDELSEKLKIEMGKGQQLENEVLISKDKIEQVELELHNLREVRLSMGMELSSEQEKCEKFEMELNEERSRRDRLVLDMEAGQEKVREIHIKLEEEIGKYVEVSKQLVVEREATENMKREVEEERVIFEERQITLLAEKTKLRDDFDLITKEKDNVALQLAQKNNALLSAEKLYDAEVQKVEGVTQLLVDQKEVVRELDNCKLNLEANFQKSEKEVASADERLETLQKEKYDFLDKIELLESENKDISSEKGLLDAKVSGYEEHVKNLDAKIEEREAKIEKLTDHMETQRTNHLNKDAELTSANDELAKLEKKLVTKTQEAVNAVSSQDDKYKECVSLQTTIEERSKQIMDVQTLYDQKCIEMQEKDQDMEKTFEQLGAAGEQMGQLKAELAEMKDELIEVKEGLASKDVESVRLQTKLKNKETENNEVVSKTTELAVTIENFSEKIQGLELELTENSKSSDEKKKEFMDQIADLESNLFESADSKALLTEQITELKDQTEILRATNKREIEILNENLTAYATQLKEVREEESKLEKELLTIKLELQVKISGCEEHCRLIVELQNLVKNKETENRQLFKFVKEKEDAIKDLNGKVDTLTAMKEEFESKVNNLRADLEKEVVLKGVNEQEIEKLQFLVEEGTSKLSGDEKEIVIMKEKSIELEKKVQLLKSDKSNLDKTVENLEADKNCLQAELDKVAEENKSMEDVLEGIEQKRQDLELEKQRLNDTLSEIGANCDKRGEENRQHLVKIKSLEERLENVEKEKGDNYDELTHKVEFLQSQMEDMENEKDEMKSQLEEMKEEKIMLEKDKAAIEESLANVTEKRFKQIENEKQEMKGKIEEFEKLLDESNKESQKLTEEMKTLKQTKSDVLQEKEEIRKEVQEMLDDKNKLSEKAKDVDTKLLIQKDKLAEYETIVANLSTEIENIKSEKSDIEVKFTHTNDSNKKFESRNKKLEEDLKVTKDSRESLASSVSQLITDTNELKEKVEFNNIEHEKEKLRCERENQELKITIEEKEKTLAELVKKGQAKAVLDSEMEIQIKKNEEQISSIHNLQTELEKLKYELAITEIKYTDLEQATQDQGVTEVKEALKAQKERYEANHKKIVDTQTEKYKAKLQEFAKLTEQQLEKKNEEVKKIDEEKRTLTAKCESYKGKVADMVEKLGENEKLNNEEVDVLHSKYNRSKEEIVRIQKKYEAAKQLIHKLTEDKQNIMAELDKKHREAKESDSETLKRELVKIKTENRTLTNQLSYADTKLREVNKFVDVRPSTRSRENSMGSHNSEKERSSLDFRSRESISSIVRGDNMPRTSSRQSLSRDSSDSSIARSRPSVPGRADRQSRQSTSTLDDSVFKLPGPNTPGRAKTGRTVSDSRMAASKYRPPHGSGSLFSCDEEAGEMFSSSYLMDLKEGNCDVTQDTSSRWSEMARRNTLCLPHLKSAYPVESQFCEDRDVTEEGIRQSRLGRLTDLPSRNLADVNSPAPSPVTRLSQAASNLSLESPATSTRSKKTQSQTSEQSNTSQRSKLPPPTAFNIDPPKPGMAIRKNNRSTAKLGASRTSLVTSKTSSTGSLARVRPARPPRPTKQACTAEHGTRKVDCEEKHSRLENLENLPVDDPVSRYLSEGDISVSTPGSGIKRKKGIPSVHQSEDLDCSQDSFSSSFSRSSLRSSKRLKAGNMSYNKPGPPTPGRNKSLGNLSLPRPVNTSNTSLETSSYPGVSSNTPDMSRVSTRSAISLKTPLLDTTNTPNKSKNQSRLSKMTPLGIRKVLGSAFRNKKYKLMKKQDNTINRDQSIKTTPLKAKDKAVSSPRKKLK